MRRKVSLVAWLGALLSLAAAAEEPKEIGEYLASASALRARGGKFSWDDAAKGVFQLLQGELADDKKSLKKVENRFTGVFLTETGYFVAPYPLFAADCLKERAGESRLSRPLCCSGETRGTFATLDKKLHPVYVVSHLTAKESLHDLRGADGAETYRRLFAIQGFVVGKVGTFGTDGKAEETFSVKVKPLETGWIKGVEKAPSDYTIFTTPMRVFVPGYLPNKRFTVATGFLTTRQTRARGFITGPLERANLVKVLAEAPDDVAQRVLANWDAVGFDKLGLTLRDTLKGAPALAADGTVLAYAYSIHESRNEVVFLSTNVLLDSLFTKTKPDSPLVELNVAGDNYYLKK